MKIYFNDRSMVPPYLDLECVGDLQSGHFVLWHNLDADVSGFLRSDEARAFTGSRGAMLLISGSPCHALSEKTVRELEELHRDRVHFLRTSYSAKNPPPLLGQFLTHVQDLSPEVIPEWNRIDPPKLGEKELGELSDTIRKGLSGNQEIRVMSYAQDFTELWAMLTGSPKNLPKTLVVIWDYREAAFRVIPSGDYLTAFDWVAALTLTQLDIHGPIAPAPPWRVLILDLASAQHPTSMAVRLFAKSGTLFPMVKVFPAAQAEDLIACASAPTQPPQDPIDLGLLRRLWQASLSSTEQGDRHAIANLIGPLLLGADTSKLPPPQLAEREALRLLAGALKLLFGQSGATPPYPWTPSSCAIDCCVLIDDLADAGWSSFLEQAVGTIPLKSFSKVDGFKFGPGSKSGLIELIRVPLRDGRRRLTLTGARREVVFLDLRLFADSRSTAELGFLTSLLRIAQTVPEGTAGLVWPGIPQSDLDAVERYVDHKQREREDYHIALSLLPRLLALADPCLPIVVFSSTTNRTILDRFIGYDNIILDFEKPRYFGGASARVVEATHERFVRAFAEAGRWDEARERHRLLTDAPLPKPNTDGGPLVDVYIDESGSEYSFSVGGVLLTYPSQAARDGLDNILRGRSLVWGLSEDDLGIPNIPGNYFKKSPPMADYQGHLQGLDCQVFEPLGIRVRAFALVHQDPPHVDRSRPTMLDPDSLDNTYRLMLNEVLEAVLFDVIGAFLQKPKKIRVNVGTRVFPAKPMRQKVWKYRFGMASNGGKCFSLSANEVHPILAQLFRRRHPLPSVVEARAVKLEDYDDLEKISRRPDARAYTKEIQRDPRPRQIHYLADWLARIARWEEKDRNLCPLAMRWFEGGFLQARDEAFQHWLDAGRAAARKDYASAMRRAAEAKSTPSSHDGFARWMESTAAKWAKDAPGCDLGPARNL